MSIWDDLGALVIPIAVGVLVLACVIGGLILFEQQACINTGEVTGLTVEWRVFGGCFVELDGRMIPYDTWQLIQIQQVDK